MPEREALANRLKEYRKIHKLSQQDFAWDCGLSRELISLIERQDENVKLDTLQSIAAYTGMTVSDLLSTVDLQSNGQKKNLN